jgi:hypothetical protein
MPSKVQPSVKKPTNLKRAQPGPWNSEETFNTADPIKGVPKKGWCLVNGKTSAQSNLYYDGRPVEHVAAINFTATAGSVATQLDVKIVLPNLTVITRQDDD